MGERTYFTQIDPGLAADIRLPRPDIQGPLTQDGRECPWPWDPMLLREQPVGLYPCPHCGELVLGGMPHVDYGVYDAAGQARREAMGQG